MSANIYIIHRLIERQLIVFSINSNSITPHTLQTLYLTVLENWID